MTKACAEEMASEASLPTDNLSTAHSLSSFGFKLFSSLVKQEGGGERDVAQNVVLSPLVVAGALALVMAGATKGSASQLELGKLLAIERHDAVPLLASLMLSSSGGVSLAVSNGIFVKQGPILPSYISIVSDLHHAHAAQLGHSYAPINAWVSNRTDGRIDRMFAPEEPVDPLTVAVLLSAVVFKGEWAHEFDPRATVPHLFVDTSGNQMKTDFMAQTEMLRASASVAELGGAAVVELEYGVSSNGMAHSTEKAAPTQAEYAAYFVLPPTPGVSSLTRTLDSLLEISERKTQRGSRRLEDVLSALPKQRVALRVPKLRATYGTASLKQALHSLGISAPFGFGGPDGGQFGQMSDDPTVYIHDLLTQSALELDEKGTVATAAAAAVMRYRSIPRPPLEVHLDRPFLMLILHLPTGMPLFISQIAHPE